MTKPPTRRNILTLLAGVLALSAALPAAVVYPSQDIEWFGTVVAQSDLSPIGGARLSVEAIPAGGLMADLAPLEDPASATGSTLATGSGRLAIVAPSGRRLRISAPGFLDGFVLLREGRDNNLGRLVLREELSFSGRVVLEGQPVANVQVLARTDYRGQTARARWISKTATDSEGRFTLGGLRSDELRELLFVHDGIAEPLSMPRLIDARPHDIGDVRLRPRLLVTGRVLDTDDRPISGALVRTSHSDSIRTRSAIDWNDAAWEHVPEINTTTDTDGSFSLTSLPGEHELEAIHPVHGYRRIEFERAPNEPERLDPIVLPGTVTRSGRVTDSNGTPLADVAITASWRGNWQSIVDGPNLLSRSGFRVRTDSAGCFTVTGLPGVEPFWINAQQAGFVDAYWHHDSAGREATDNTMPCGNLGDLVMERGGTISGTVTDGSGRPIPGATVHSQHHQIQYGAHWAQSSTITTDVNGQFRFEDVARGYYDLSVRAAGYAPGNVASIGLESPQEHSRAHVEVALEPIAGGATSELEIVVFDPRGAPEPEAEVRTSPAVGTTGAQLPRQNWLTGADGRVFHRSLPDGDYMVHAIGYATGNNSYSTGPYPVGPNSSAAVIEMPATRTPLTTLTGRFVDERGEGIVNAVVSVDGVRGNNREPTAITEADGSFRFDRIPAGPYLLSARPRELPRVLHPGRLEIPVSGVSGLLVELPPLAEASGVVAGLRAEEVEQLKIRATLAVEHDDGVRHSTSVAAVHDMQGRFVLEGLIPGEWTIRAQVGSGRWSEAPLSVIPLQQPAAVRVELPTGFTLRGRINWATPPLPQARLDLGGLTTRHSELVTVDESGEFEFRDLAAGDYRLIVGGTGLNRAPLYVVSVREDTSVELSVRGTTVRGVVSDAATGAPLAGAHWNAEGIGNVLQSSHADIGGRTGRDGSFTPGRIPSGRWKLTIRASGYATMIRTLDLQGDSADLTLDLVRSPGLAVRVETPFNTPLPMLGFSWHDLTTGEGTGGSFFPAPSSTPWSFVWDGIGLGRGVLQANNNREWLAARAVVVNDGTPVTLQLVWAGRLRVTLPAPQVPSFESATARIYDGDGFPVTRNGNAEIGFYRGRDGSMSLSLRTVPGEYRIEISMPDGRTLTETFELFPRADTILELR